MQVTCMTKYKNKMEAKNEWRMMAKMKKSTMGAKTEWLMNNDANDDIDWLTCRNVDGVYEGREGDFSFFGSAFSEPKV